MKRSKSNDFGKPDHENPEWTKADFARARRIADDPVLRARIGRAVGRPPGQSKSLVHIRIDKDVLARLRASGKGWQSRINGLLRAGVGLTGGGL